MSETIHEKEKRLVREILREATSNPLSGKTKDLFQGWLVSDDGRPEKDEVLQELFLDDFQSTATPSNEAYERLSKMWSILGFPDSEFPSKPAPEHKSGRSVPLRGRRPLWIAGRVAAVVIPLLVIGAVAFMVRNADRAGQVPPMAQTTITATAGEQKQIALADGSSVELSGGGVLSYNDLREVMLRGQARFRVEKRTDAQGNRMPFTVKTEHLTVRVLGTDFRVTAHDGYDYSEVDLYSGIVEVEAGGATTLLAPGDHYRYDHAGATSTVGRIAATEMARAGYKPSLALEGVTLAQALEAIEANYGVKIETGAAVNLAGNYAIDLTHGETLDEALSLLGALTEKFTYTIDGDTVRIRKR